MRDEWSCEHCGMGTRSSPYECDFCGSSMCEHCADECTGDDPLACPVLAEQADGAPENER